MFMRIFEVGIFHTNGFNSSFQDNNKRRIRSEAGRFTAWRYAFAPVARQYGSMLRDRRRITILV